MRGKLILFCGLFERSPPHTHKIFFVFSVSFFTETLFCVPLCVCICFFFCETDKGGWVGRGGGGGLWLSAAIDCELHSFIRSLVVASIMSAGQPFLCFVGAQSCRWMDERVGGGWVDGWCGSEQADRDGMFVAHEAYLVRLTLCKCFLLKRIGIACCSRGLLGALRGFCNVSLVTVERMAVSYIVCNRAAKLLFWEGGGRDRGARDPASASINRR